MYNILFDDSIIILKYDVTLVTYLKKGKGKEALLNWTDSFLFLLGKRMSFYVCEEENKHEDLTKNR